MNRETLLLRRLIRESLISEAGPQEKVKEILAPLGLQQTIKSTLEKHIGSAQQEITAWLENHGDYMELAKQGDAGGIKEKLLPLFKTRQKKIDNFTLQQAKSNDPQRPNDPALQKAMEPDEPIRTLLKTIDNRILRRLPTSQATGTSQMPPHVIINIIAASLVAVAGMNDGEEETAAEEEQEE